MAAASRMDHPRLSPRPRLGGRSRNHHLGLAFPPVPSLPRRSGPLPRISPGRAPSPASTASAPRIPASAASPRGAEAAARSQGAPKRRPVPVNPGRRVCLRFPLPRRKGLPCPPGLIFQVQLRQRKPGITSGWLLPDRFGLAWRWRVRKKIGGRKGRQV